jgi:glycerol uptake facilitator-like aquaporin
MTERSLGKRVAAEFVGTAFLVAAVVGSGIMAEKLSGGNLGLALLANTIATGAVLVALILTFGSISGAHFNPGVSVADALERGLSWHDIPSYITAQVLVSETTRQLSCGFRMKSARRITSAERQITSAERPDNPTRIIY